MIDSRLLNEDEVIERTCEWLDWEGWAIKRRLAGKARGIDIIAQRDGRYLFIEAKGCTTGVKRDRIEHSQAHRTNAALAAFGKLLDLYQQAHPRWMLDSLPTVDRSSTKNEPFLALALPDDRVFRKQVKKAMGGLDRLGAAVLWVSKNGVDGWNHNHLRVPSR